MVNNTKYSIPIDLLEEGFVLYSAWKMVKYYDTRCLSVLELSVKRKHIARHFALFPVEKISKKCGSYEYRYCRYQNASIRENNKFLEYDSFEYVLCYAPFDFINELVKVGIGQARLEIERFRRHCIRTYGNQKPKHSLCNLKPKEKCRCTVKLKKYPEIVKPVQIGFGLESKVKIPRVRSSDVVKDPHTTAAKEQDKHILYAAGWSLSEADKT
jgi:hypothetical protein